MIVGGAAPAPNRVGPEIAVEPGTLPETMAAWVILKERKG